MRLGMLISSWGRPCGVGEYGKALVEALQRLGQAVAVLTVPPAEVATLARARGLDLVHFQYEYNLYDAGELGSAVADLARSGIQSVVTVHSWTSEAAYANSLLRTGVPHFIATLPAMRLAMQREGINPSRVAVIPIGIRSHPLPPRQESRAALGLGGEPAVGFFGFYHRHKGIENLLRAVGDLRDRHPGIRCFLFASVAPNEGSRQAFERVREFLDADGPRDRVFMQTDYLPEEEVVRHLHAMDVNVLPYGELEGIQASAAARTVLAARRPTVVTDTAHFSDLRHGVYKIPDNAPSHIAAAVTDILDHGEKARELVEAAHLAADMFSWDEVAATHKRYYGVVLRSYKRPRSPQATRTW